ncbi:hypothetical protein NLX67_08225 [Domibacillus sp. A3M-37]|uniref:hypothetical protein n=1 Tax=Domibacillus sp. A3M-37 TaxID=2962037 RepID=UPI0020B8FF85|nr:hypothetical protein [Domibacillus sp. A3M-37]MCP3762375.1 hypothetical protein [Domibacillus sp. A3M-37]
MNNRNGMLSSLFTWVTTAAAILGLARGMRNGTFQPFLQTIRSFMSGSAAQQIPQAVQGMMNGQAAQNMAQPLQGIMNNQGSQQQSSNQKPNNMKQSITNPSNNKSN